VLFVPQTRAVGSLVTSALRATVVGATATGLGLLARAGWGVPAALGASREEIALVAATSPRYDGSAFRNSEPDTMLPVNRAALVLEILTRGPAGTPAGPVPLVVPEFPSVADQLAVTWYGHSTVLVEIDGRRVLVDPVWSDRASPSPLLGPKRMYPVPTGLDALPRLDAVLISHDHYDHLDLPTVRELLRLGPAVLDGPFVVPLGVGAHLRSWGVPADRVVELDWGGQVRVRDLTLTCAEARHFSGRGLARNTTLWSSWVIAGPQHGVFFGGDTGYTASFAEIGARFGPFNLTLLPVGAYYEQWPDVHMTPEQAVRAHGDLGGGLLVPVHWSTFNLAFHPWVEPVRRVLAEADRVDARVAVPRPGERFRVSEPPDRDWWSALAGS
jgi:L-ascorbate metabolism protein UlaG (beta-lactamase superfamily)